MSLVLYSKEASPPCRSVLMVVELLGLDVRVELVDPMKGDTRKPEYLEKNPAHTIPLLEDRDFILADSHAIITYLVSKYGAEHRATLYPSDLRVRATVDQRLFFDSSVLFPTFWALVMELVVNKVTEVPPAVIAKFEDAYGILEKYLEKSEYLAGEDLTLADIACAATVSSLAGAVPLDGWPRAAAWLRRLQQHHWYQTGNQPGLDALNAILQAKLKN